ncbi:hypothetical protein B0H14DRAFT_2999183 [Mycena olivaceomarginata]|nr:hypothetical protein B0H14DRAFT_2999183 [Mycena olivaceomarginata]
MALRDFFFASDEEASFGDRERRYEACERAHVDKMIKQANDRQQAIQNTINMYIHLDTWDDDTSDEMFYVNREGWREVRARALAAEKNAEIATAEK